MIKAIAAKVPNTHIPKVAIAYCTPHVKMQNNGVRTKAYSFETESLHLAQ